MAEPENRLFDQFAKLATDAAAVAQGMRREAESAVRAQAERLLAEMNVVHRDEFDATKELVVRLREENDRLRERVDALERRLGQDGSGPVA